MLTAWSPATTAEVKEEEEEVFKSPTRVESLAEMLTFGHDQRLSPYSSPLGYHWQGRGRFPGGVSWHPPLPLLHTLHHRDRRVCLVPTLAPLLPALPCSSDRGLPAQ